MQIGGGGGGAGQIGVICGSTNRWKATTRQYWVYCYEKWGGGGGLAMLLLKTGYVRLHQDFSVQYQLLHHFIAHLTFTSYHQIHLLMKS